MTEPVPIEANELLRPALAAAHRALQRLEDEDVPATLRPVRAASKNRRLPMPLRRALVRHLEDEWLRTLALEHLAGGEGPDIEASRLYLERPDDWEARVSELGESGQMQEAERTIDALTAERDHLRKVNRELTERLSRRESDIAALERRLVSDDRLDALRRRLDQVSKEVGHRQSEVEDREAEIARLREELAEADERIGTLRSRSMRPASETAEGAGNRTFGRGNPLESARFLDGLIEAMRPLGEKDEDAEPLAALRLPAGVRPDSSDAIDWIMTIERRATLIVDGHNIAHDLAAEPGRSARDRVVYEVGRLRRLANGPLATVVFFDTDHESETYRNAGVSVRYVPDADEAIVALAAELDHPAIVISTDKDVRDRSMRQGAITLWGTALSAWIRRH